jgi:hypothetical protein
VLFRQDAQPPNQPGPARMLRPAGRSRLCAEEGRLASIMPTWWPIFVKRAGRLHSANGRLRQPGCIGVLLAFSAVLGQFLIAAHASGIATDQGIAIVLDAGHAARPHDPARCPSCQAAAHARDALGALSIAHPLPVAPRLGAVKLVSADVPGALARWTAPPRAPPA